MVQDPIKVFSLLDERGNVLRVGYNILDISHGLQPGFSITCEEEPAIPNATVVRWRALAQRYLEQFSSIQEAAEAFSNVAQQSYGFSQIFVRGVEFEASTQPPLRVEKKVKSDKSHGLSSKLPRPKT